MQKSRRHRHILYVCIASLRLKLFGTDKGNHDQSVVQNLQYSSQVIVRLHDVVTLDIKYSDNNQRTAITQSSVKLLATSNRYKVDTNVVLKQPFVIMYLSLIHI